MSWPISRRCRAPENARPSRCWFPRSRLSTPSAGPASRPTVPTQ
jgi:hypothetical protein